MKSFLNSNALPRLYQV